MAKLSQKELETLQSLNNEFTKTKGAIADVEIQKHSLINSLGELKEKFAKEEEKLIKKYGENSVVNIQTGEVSEKKE
jgi:hypothetical protein